MQFHILSFEGPDPYSRAGGIASRVTGMARTLAAQGIETHLWFVGDPDRSGREDQDGVHLHRWCQWISHYHPIGVYDGEEGKVSDYARSLPPFLVDHAVVPAVARGERVVVLAEEWHTVDAVLHLDWLLRERGLRERVSIVWTANNVFGFETIDWPRLASAAQIATVSRYMRERMRPLGVSALVLSNGLTSEAFDSAEWGELGAFEQIAAGRLTLAKMARFDPDKRWLGAVESVAALRHMGQRPLLIARGGAEAYGGEVLARARQLGLACAQQRLEVGGAAGLLAALRAAERADILLLESHVDADARRLLFQASSAVLANSAHEPFGLVGLEAMAVGGLACTGCTGEDYAVAGENSISLQTEDPRELVASLQHLRADPTREQGVRDAARRSAKSFHWQRVLERTLFPYLQFDVARRAA